MVAEASGCWASEVNAVATDRPSARAGPIVPKPVVMPAMTIDATAIVVMLSIGSPFVAHASMYCLSFRRADPGGGRDVNRCQDAEDVGLHHASEQTKRRHKDREDKRRD